MYISIYLPPTSEKKGKKMELGNSGHVLHTEVVIFVVCSGHT